MTVPFRSCLLAKAINDLMVPSLMCSADCKHSVAFLLRRTSDSTGVLQAKAPTPSKKPTPAKKVAAEEESDEEDEEEDDSEDGACRLG